ncbi:MAG: response regulator [Bacteroidetes bacterium]|nr:response regulator [Bacteroidota bacterium]
MEITYSGVKKKRILIVEDEQIIAEDIAYRLNALGYEVADKVATGHEAVEKAGTLSPDLILMDIVLKGTIDGIQAHEMIKEKYDIPVIFLTSFSDETTFSRAKMTQPFGYIIKPFEERELKSNIEIALYKHEIENKLKSSLEVQKLISEISEYLLGLPAGRIDEGLDRAVQLVGEFSGEDHVYVYSFDRGSDSFLLLHEWYDPGVKHNNRDYNAIKKEDIVGLLSGLKKNSHIYIQDIKEAHTDGLVEKRIANESDAKSTVMIPIKSGDEITGLIGFDSYLKPKHWDEGEITTLNLFGEIIENALRRKHIETQLIESEKNLKEINASKDRFFSIISHDLKNPFAGIMGFTEVLYDSFDVYDDAEKKRMLFMIKNAATSTYKLLENLLEWSRIQLGAVKPVFSKNDASALVNEAILLIRDIAAAKNIKIVNEVPLNTEVFCDGNMIKLIFRNLLSNAVKFSNQGKTVKVCSDACNGTLKISVKDEGIGISGNVIPTLFRIDRANSSKGTMGEKGTGLGLILCRNFAEMNNSNITVQSEEGKGSVFTLSMPAGGD